MRKDILSHIVPNGIFSANNFLNVHKDGMHIAATLFQVREMYNSKFFSYLIYYLFYVFSFASLLGIFTNFSLLMLFIVYGSIQNRAIPVWSTAGDQVIKLLILCLGLSKCGEVFSIDSLTINNPENYVNGWPIRLFQVYLSWVYFNAGVAKTKDSLWGAGKALRYATLNPGWGKRYGYVVKLFDRESTKILNYSVIIIQFFAPLFLWLKDTRLIYTLILMSFHLGIFMTLRLGYFGPVMIVSLFSFLDFLFK